jgi:hypothetical protein
MLCLYVNFWEKNFSTLVYWQENVIVGRRLASMLRKLLLSLAHQAQIMPFDHTFKRKCNGVKVQCGQNSG